MLTFFLRTTDVSFPRHMISSAIGVDVEPHCSAQAPSAHSIQAHGPG